jgi:hypothetical protein
VSVTISMNQMNGIYRWVATSLAIAAFAVQASAQKLDGNFEMLDQWVEVEKSISKEKYDWEVQKQGLKDLLGVYQQELEALDETIKEAEDFTSAADSKKSGLLEEQTSLKAIESKLVELVVQQELTLKALIKRLPEPLVQEIAPLAQRIPQDSLNTSLSLSQRLQSLVGILTQVDKFNTTVEVVPDQREFGDGQMVQVKVIYFGLGASYYVDASAEHAGYGKPTSEGWEWVTDDAIAANVSDMIAMYEGNTTEVKFVPVPVNLNN